MTKLRLISHIFCSFATLTSHNKANYHRIYHHCRDLLPTHRAGSMAYSHVRAWIKVNKFRCCGWTDALHIMRWPAGIFFSSTINWASRQSSFVSRHTGHCFPFHKIERQTKKKKKKPAHRCTRLWCRYRCQALFSTTKNGKWNSPALYDALLFFLSFLSSSFNYYGKHWIHLAYIVTSSDECYVRPGECEWLAYAQCQRHHCLTTDLFIVLRSRRKVFFSSLVVFDDKLKPKNNLHNLHYGSRRRHNVSRSIGRATQ